MNRLLSMSLISLSLLILTGCHDDNDHDDHNSVVVVDEDPVTCEATADPINKFIRVHVTYGLLDEGAYIPGETGGFSPLTITTPINAGETAIAVASTASLVDGQLLSYLGVDGSYSVGKILSTTENTVTLKKPILFDLAAGSNSLWNFYEDATHPNSAGFKVLADFAFNSASDYIEPNKVHALLGDSWFKPTQGTAFADRLLERLPTGSIIKNEGVGGHSLCGLLARVDEMMNTHNPSYVWINSSINDYFDGVTQEQYKVRMQYLISKIQAAGAIAIVMDPAPGMPNQSTDDGITFTMLSQRYATQILNLLAEAE